MSFDAMSIGLDEWSDLDFDTLDGKALTRHLAQLEQLSTRMRAAVLATLGEFEDRGLHFLEFAPTTKAWLTAQVGIGAASAAAQTSLAKALRRMPLVAEAFGAGRISEDHARLLVRCTKARTSQAYTRDEELLVAKAVEFRVVDFEQIIQRWLLANDPDGNEPADPDSDQVCFSRVGDRYRLSGEFGLERGLALHAALREKTDALFRIDRGRRTADPFDPSLDRSPAQRRAEALAELVELGAAAPTSTKRRRPLVLIRAEENPDGELEYTSPDGTIIALSVARLLTEDAHLARVVFGTRNELLDLGRAARVATEPMRNALMARDGHTCNVEGCDVPGEWCDAHHIVWWEQGGRTTVANLVLLCRHHHRRIHHKQLNVEMNDTGRPVFTDTMGRELTLQTHRHPPPDVTAA